MLPLTCHRRISPWSAFEKQRGKNGTKAGPPVHDDLCAVVDDEGRIRHGKFVHAINRHGMVGSMGRVGVAGDNAAMESFFPPLPKNVLDRRSWTTREELRIAIVRWIERTYHRRRRQAARGRFTPVEYELIMTPTATQAP